MITKIINANIILENEIVNGKSIFIENGVITDVSDKDMYYDNLVDANGKYVSAGFIDIHVHGAVDNDFADSTPDGVIKAANFHCKHGTTTIYPTTLSASYQAISNSLEAIKVAMQSDELLPEIGGVHLEGPYFSKKQSGAQNPEFITPPIKADYERILKNYGDIIKRWSFAPELEGSDAFIDSLKDNSVIASVGHSDAVYDDMLAAYEKGVRLITHFYSCISTITREKGFRKLGVTEFGYLLDDVVAEAIADGCHIPTELFRLLYKIKGSDNICLVTDAMRCCGIDDEFSSIGGIKCKIKNGVAYLMDESAFAGSIATADRLVRFCVKDVGIDICNAVKMITVNPAKAMKLANKGKIEAGYIADLVIFDEDINIDKVIVAGKII